MSETANMDVVPDSEHRGIVARLPQVPRDLAQLARFDRPIGWWLLFWPCAWGVWLTGAGWQLELVAWLLLGSIAMRGAGCVYNDIVDADLDRKVARTAARPVASGRISKKLAWGWLCALGAVGLLVLLQLRPIAQGVALASVLLVAAYPFMKRITWWPQAWLGMVFTWGLLVGWTQLRADNLDALAAMYAGAALWVIGYDTIYAMQDREDDALVGIKSTARLFADKSKKWVGVFFILALTFFTLAKLTAAGLTPTLGLMALPAAHAAWQVRKWDINNNGSSLRMFKANRDFGLLLFLAFVI